MLSLDQQDQWRERYRSLHPEWQPATKVYEAMVKQCLEPDSRLLDLGCGRGGLIEQLDHPLSQITGIDPDWLSLSDHRLAARDPSLARVAGGSRHLPFADDVFDLVLAGWVLEHLAKPAVDFQEISRVLAPGGYFIFITPNRKHPLALLYRHLPGRSILQRRLVKGLYDRSPVDTFQAFYQANDINSLHELSSASNLDVVEIKAIDDPTYLALSPRMFNLACKIERRLPADRRIHLVGCLKCEKS